MALSQQQIFTKVKNHLLKQKKVSVDEDGYCMYRFFPKDEGFPVLMCAVGCLISDMHYSNELEGKGVFDTQVIRALQASDVLPQEHHDTIHLTKEGKLLSALQHIHDSYIPCYWPEELRKTAHLWGLQYDNIESLSNDQSPTRN